MSKKPKKNPVVVSVINLKGGVGKTTVAVMLARHAAKMNLSVLVVDLDPQANLSQALMTEKGYKQFMESREPSVVELFNGYLPPSPERSAPAPLNYVLNKVGTRENFHLIPSRFDFADNLISSVRVDERVLARYISDEMRDKDLILIDCAPTESVLTRTAYHASRHVLVPVRTEFFSTIGFPLLKESLEKFKGDNPSHAIDVCGALINNSETQRSSRGPHHAAARKDIREKAGEYGWPIMENEMFLSRGYPKLMKEEYPTHIRNAGPESQKIANEFIKKMGLSSQEEERRRRRAWGSGS